MTADPPIAPRRPTPWRLYARYYRRSRLQLLGATALAIAQAAALLPIPFAFGLAFDRAIPSRDSRTLALIVVGVLGLNLLSAALGVLSRHLSLKVTKQKLLEVRRDLLERLYRMPRGDSAGLDYGRVHDLMVHDTERLDIMTSAIVFHVLPAACLAAGIGTILFYLNPRLTLITLALLPLLVLASHLIRERLKARTRAFHRAFERYSRGIWFVLEAMDLTRFQAAESREITHQQEHMARLKTESQAMAWLQSASSVLHMALVAAAAVLVLLIGGLGLSRGSMTLGNLFAFFAGLALLRSPVGTGLVVIPQLIEGSESLDRIAALLTHESEPPYSGTRTWPVRGRIRLEDVHFGYEGRSLLRGVNLDLRPGSSVGLFGPSGTGKTTLVMLILGFYRPRQGSILVDDEPLDSLDISHLRRQIGVLPQDPLVFPGTVWENITYGCDDIERATVIETARLATAHEFIEALPDAYETVVGERGVRLSGGQRQRIALARALLRRPRLLILDEPTNHLGATTVEHILDSVARWTPRPAVLLISHEQRVARCLDHAYGLDDGRLAPLSHDALAGLVNEPLPAPAPSPTG
jgi:ABC-type multidrug transport system fused ATPase/permease subunit